MKYTIYKTTNLFNGKFYIGMHQTTDPNDDYLGSGKLIGRAIEKYGRENFSKEVLYVFDNEKDMISKEAEIVTDKFLEENTKECYNLISGGKGGFGYANKTGKSKNLFNKDNALKYSKKASERKKWLWENDQEWSEKYKDSLRKGYNSKGITSATEKAKKTNLGSKFIHKDGVVKKAKDEELKKCLNDGWHLGKLIKTLKE